MKLRSVVLSIAVIAGGVATAAMVSAWYIYASSSLERLRGTTRNHYIVSVTALLPARTTPGSSRPSVFASCGKLC